MSDVVDHYDNLLAEHYTWMGGASFEDQVDQQREMLAALGVQSSGGIALDLGCGAGVQSMALAQLGHRLVIGVDISSRLLAEFADRTRSLPNVRGVQADIDGGLAGIVEPGTVQTAVCMGDTLTHLMDVDAVNRLFVHIHRLLRADGQFVVSFRDLTQTPQGLGRFIPVHSDENTIMTCFIEDTGPDAVQIHDLIHHRTPENWTLSKGTYRKLKLGHAQVAEQLRMAGFTVAEPALGPQRMWIVNARHTG